MFGAECRFQQLRCSAELGLGRLGLALRSVEITEAQAHARLALGVALREPERQVGIPQSFLGALQMHTDDDDQRGRGIEHLARLSRS